MTCLYYQKIASETYIDNGNTHLNKRKKQANKTVTCHHAMPCHKLHTHIVYAPCLCFKYFKIKLDRTITSI